MEQRPQTECSNIFRGMRSGSHEVLDGFSEARLAGCAPAHTQRHSHSLFLNALGQMSDRRAWPNKCSEFWWHWRCWACSEEPKRFRNSFGSSTGHLQENLSACSSTMCKATANDPPRRPAFASISGICLEGCIVTHGKHKAPTRHGTSTPRWPTKMPNQQRRRR